MFAGATPGFPLLPGLLVAACLVLFAAAWLRGWSARPLVAVAVTLATRVVMVALANGHTPRDVTRYFQLAGMLVAQGQDPLTRQPEFQWNFLPLMPYVFALEQQLGLSWEVAGKIAPVLADVAVTVLLGRLATGPDRLRVPLLYALCPVAVLVTGLHGQVEPVALALGLGGLLLARQHRVAGSGVLLGLAVATKTWPVLLVLGPLRETPVRRWWRLALPLGAVLVALLLSIPAFLHDSLRAAVHVLVGYRSFTGVWGWTGLLNYFGVVGGGYRGPGVDTVQHVGTVVTLVAVAAAVARFRRAGAVPLTAAVLLTFLVVTAGFGPQYLLWPLPFVLLLRRRTGLVFAVAASLYAAYAYWLVADGTPVRSDTLNHLLQWASLPVIAAAALALPWSRAREPVPA
ncbi:MAG TPA: glycosyltransferase 87 family protein [Mycobacteriales bacterium]|nr:glycosyltransferase 87 family protein [Mycobacteriales bacterium]